MTALPRVDVDFNGIDHERVYTLVDYWHAPFPPTPGARAVARDHDGNTRDAVVMSVEGRVMGLRVALPRGGRE